MVPGRKIRGRKGSKRLEGRANLIPKRLRLLLRLNVRATPMPSDAVRLSPISAGKHPGSHTGSGIIIRRPEAVKHKISQGGVITGWRLPSLICPPSWAPSRAPHTEEDLGGCWAPATRPRSKQQPLHGCRMSPRFLVVRGTSWQVPPF